MEIQIVRPENEPEADMWGEKLIMDKGGCDIEMADGTRYSANWGDDMYASDVACALILNEFLESDRDSQTDILNQVREVVDDLENKLCLNL